MSLVERLGARARSAGPAHLLAALVAVLVTYGLTVFANREVEAALRFADCSGLDCLKTLRPETRIAGYTADEFRAFLAAIGLLRGKALVALLADLPFIAATATALLVAAGLATREAAFLSERTRTLVIVLPLAYAAADLIEDAGLAATYSGLADLAVALPWISALKFGLAVASALISLFLGFARSNLE